MPFSLRVSLQIILDNIRGICYTYYAEIKEIP